MATGEQSTINLDCMLMGELKTGISKAKQDAKKRVRGDGKVKPCSDGSMIRENEEERRAEQGEETQQDEDNILAMIVMSQQARSSRNTYQRSHIIEEQQEVPELQTPEEERPAKRRKSTRIAESDTDSSDGEDDEEADSIEDPMVGCDNCGVERSVDVMEKCKGELLCPTCRQELYRKLAASRKAAKLKGDVDDGEPTLEVGEYEHEWDGDEAVAVKAIIPESQS